MRSRRAAARRPRGAPGRWDARSASPTSPRSASARSRSSDPARPVGASFASTFSSAVSVGIRLNCWKTNPKERSRSSASSASGRPARSRPPKDTRPLEGRSSAPRSCNRVVLPEPLGPSIATNSPASMVRSTSRTALMIVGPRAKDLPTPLSSYWLIPRSSMRRPVADARRAMRRPRLPAGRRGPRARSP